MKAALELSDYDKAKIFFHRFTSQDLNPILDDYENEIEYLQGLIQQGDYSKELFIRNGYEARTKIRLYKEIDKSVISFILQQGFNKKIKDILSKRYLHDILESNYIHPSCTIDLILELISLVGGIDSEIKKSLLKIENSRLHLNSV